LDPTAWRALRLFGWYRRGLLPMSGGLLEQSATYLDAMALIETELAGYPEDSNGR
jgi:hypothetical protein